MNNFVDNFNLNFEDVQNIALSYEGYAKYLSTPKTRMMIF